MSALHSSKRDLPDAHLSTFMRRPDAARNRVQPLSGVSLNIELFPLCSFVPFVVQLFHLNAKQQA
jgi:hypothetical protein